MPPHPRFVFAALALAATAVSQSVVVPSMGGEGGSMDVVGGFDRAARQQIVLDAKLLTALTGRIVRGMEFVRDASVPERFDGGSADLRITMSHTPRDALSVSDVFDENHDPVTAGRRVVFDGTCFLPASPPPLGRTTGWGVGSDVVTIAFDQPFTYAGGHLCIEIEGAPTPGRETPFWAVDAALDQAVGSVTVVGDACGPRAGRAAPLAPLTTAMTSGAVLVPGATARFSARGTVDASGWMLFGFQSVSIDLDVLGVGDPGCRLFIGDGAAFATRFVAGTAEVAVRIPAASGVLGAGFRVQFVEVGALLRTSNGLDCVIAGSVPTLGGATVYAPFDGTRPLTGRVHTGRVPLVRFVF